MGKPLCLVHFVPTQQGLPDLHCSCVCVRINKSGAHLSERLDFTVSGPRRPAEALLQDGDEAGDGLSVGAAPDLPRFCHQGESHRSAVETQCFISYMYIYISSWLRPRSIPQLPFWKQRWIFNMFLPRMWPRSLRFYLICVRGMPTSVLFIWRLLIQTSSSPGLQWDLLPGDAGWSLRGRKAPVRAVSRQLSRHPARAVVSKERRGPGAAPGLRGPGLRLGRLPEAQRDGSGSWRLLPWCKTGESPDYIFDPVYRRRHTSSWY